MYSLLTIIDARIQAYDINLTQCENNLEAEYWRGRLAEAMELLQEVLNMAEADSDENDDFEPYLGQD
jgi:hypothetical protein